MTLPTDIPLTLCYAAGDAREVDATAVKALAASIGEVGLLNPISVRRAIKVRAGQDAEAYEVLAGMHRVKAFRKLGRETIPAFVLDVDDLHAALILIDENLRRKDLSPAERAAQIAKRKRIYEALHPETAVGATGKGRRKVRQVGEPNEAGAERFTAATADVAGTSERTVQRDSHRGEALGDDVLAKVARTSLDKGDELDALAKLPDVKRDELVARASAGEKVSAKAEAKKVRRASRERVLGELQAPTGRFGVIVEDFEWDHQVWSRDTGMDRHAGNHYPVSVDAHTAEEIVRRTADRFAIADTNCVLFMWSTVQHLAIAIDVLRQRGFAYVSHYVWGKDKIGLGHWNRNKHEILLIGVKGDIPCPAAGTQWDSLQLAPRGEHSAKPECFLQMIEDYFPHLPKIELNRRGTARPGWQAWGNEAPQPDLSGRPLGDDRGREMFVPAAAGMVADRQLGGTLEQILEHELEAAGPAMAPVDTATSPDIAGEDDRRKAVMAGDFQTHVAPTAADLDIPTFLRRGHPDCFVKAPG